MSQPLHGVRVADFSHVMAGPFASHFLAAMGAEVIKVEAPGRGDPMRDYGADSAWHGMSPGFIAANCGKKSVVLDLKSDAGKQAALRLIGSCDVVLENFRPGVMDRLGLGYDVAKRLAPAVIFCSVSGYGQTGPLRDYPAIDNIVQATSGLTSLNGEADGPFMRVGFPVVDTYTGTLAALAILAALIRKGATGEGQRVDMAMFDASLVLMAAAAVPYLATGKAMPRTGNTGYSGQPTAAMFTCGDGRQVSLGVVQQEQYERLCRAMGREDLLSDTRFSTLAGRMLHAAALQAEFSKEFAKRSGADWEAALSAAGAPCGLVRTVAEACAMPNLKDRRLVVELENLRLPPKGAPLALNAGYLCDADGPDLQGPPPRLGQHTREVLEALGFSEDEINAMIANGSAAATQ
jgi:crotonobetainyl-CoA:carnitine CoA-transferase CaiB-like acyl-CoA transferase